MGEAFEASYVLLSTHHQKKTLFLNYNSVIAFGWLTSLRSVSFGDLSFSLEMKGSKREQDTGHGFGMPC